MIRQRKYVCQSQTFYQRDLLLNKVLKDCEDNFKGLDQHGRSIERTTKEFFIKFNQAKYQEQKKMVETDSVGVYAMILELIDKVSHDKPLMAYVLPTLEAIISENPKQFKQFLRAIQPTLLTKLKSLLFVEGYEPCAYEAAAKIYTMVIAEEPEYAREWVVLLVGSINQRGNKDQMHQQSNIRIADQMVMPIFVYLLKHERLAIQFLQCGGIQVIQHILRTYSTDLQVSYYTILGLWLLSYVPESYPFFNDSSLGLIRLTIETLQKISREKILRVAFACFKNLVDVSSNAIEEMVDNGLVKTVDLLLKGNLKDQDVIDDVRYVGDILEKNMKILTSFEKYVKELLAQHLQWSPVHSEKFWKENVKKFEDNDFLLIKKLSELLKSQEPQNVAIACFDLGEFCRFHPFGKVVLENLNAKTEIMRQAKSSDQQIRENALLSLQKIMLHNWQVV